MHADSFHKRDLAPGILTTSRDNNMVELYNKGFSVLFFFFLGGREASLGVSQLSITVVGLVLFPCPEILLALSVHSAVFYIPS